MDWLHRQEKQQKKRPKPLFCARQPLRSMTVRSRIDNQGNNHQLDRQAAPDPWHFLHVTLLYKTFHKNPIDFFEIGIDKGGLQQKKELRFES